MSHNFICYVLAREEQPTAAPDSASSAPVRIPMPPRTPAPPVTPPPSHMLPPPPRLLKHATDVEKEAIATLEALVKAKAKATEVAPREDPTSSRLVDAIPVAPRLLRSYGCESCGCVRSCDCAPMTTSSHMVAFARCCAPGAATAAGATAPGGATAAGARCFASLC